MPALSDAQIPKPLTYTLMYHFLWAVLFWLSALTLFLIFLSSGRSLPLVWGPPAILGVLGFIAAAGAFATYVVRVQLLLGEITRADAFRFSSISSWSVIAFAPALFALWMLVLEPLMRWRWPGMWPVPVEMSIATAQVEVVVWWLSHLLSIRGLSQGRARYLTPTATPASPFTA